MNELLQNLLKLQALQFGDLTVKDAEIDIVEIRSKIPVPILGHFDRLSARGKRGVAVIRNQVCSGCHMRLPIGVIATVMRGEDIQLCESCGRYLYIPTESEDKFLNTVEESRPAKKSKPRSRKTLANAA